MEIERFRKLTQKDVKNMYDKSLEDRYKVKQIEKQMDEVRKKKKTRYFIIIFNIHIQEEDEELRIYAEAKKKIARLRREKEIQAHQQISQIYLLIK